MKRRTDSGDDKEHGICTYVRLPYITVHIGKSVVHLCNSPLSSVSKSLFTLIYLWTFSNDLFRLARYSLTFNRAQPRIHDSSTLSRWHSWTSLCGPAGARCVLLVAGLCVRGRRPDAATISSVTV